MVLFQRVSRFSINELEVGFVTLFFISFLFLPYHGYNRLQSGWEIRDTQSAQTALKFRDRITEWYRDYNNAY